MTTQHPPARLHRLSIAAGLLLAALAGCSSTPTALEQSLGQSVRLAVQQQSLPAPAARAAQQTDGVIAVHGVERYQQSYQRPPAPVNVLNLQAGTASGSPSNLPR